MDAPAWGKAAAAVSAASSVAARDEACEKQVEEACDPYPYPNPNPTPDPNPHPNPSPNPNPNPEQVEEACDGLSLEEEAKRAWLARLDAPTWGAVAAAVSEVAAATGGDDEAAKAAWLAKVRVRVRPNLTLILTLLLTLP